MTNFRAIGALLVTAVAVLATESLGQVWAEDFASGVGRLTATRDQGGTLTYWNAAEQSIDGTLYRTERTDRRYAEIEPLVNPRSLSFSAVITPISAQGGNGIQAAVQMGFLSSQSPSASESFFIVTFNHGWSESIRNVYMRGRYDDGTEFVGRADGFVPFTFGTTYFVRAVAVFSAGFAEVWVYDGEDDTGALLANWSAQITASGALSVDGIGVSNGNRNDPSNQSPFSFRLHEISYLSSSTCLADLTTQGQGPSDPLFGIPDGLITAADLNFYVNNWVAGSPAADMTTQGAPQGDPNYGVPDGAVSASDLNYYVNLWVIGCQ